MVEEEKTVYSPPGTELKVTDRSAEQVQESLGTSIEFYKGKKVLSLGEGLSGFANRLADSGVNITAVDKVYSEGDKVLMSEPAWADIFSHNSNKKEKFISFRPPNEKFDPPNKQKVKIAAADAKALPFGDGKFDLVVANRVYEHVVMTDILPEVMRVLDNEGEFRMGGLVLHCVPKDNKLLSGVYQKDAYTFYFDENPALAESLKNLDKEYPNVSTYAVVGQPSRYSKIYNNTGAHLVNNLIFVKGNDLPKVKLNSEKDDSEYTGKLFKVNSETLEMQEVFPGDKAK